ncbi:MAG TPA: sensor histidine kinase [Gemmatimonadaceae bacterium]|nr:sensor histidine kinase [Gemmatimonadaceae bacterium]
MGSKENSRTSSLENDCPLAAVLSERLRLARHELTRHWLDRIASRVSLEPNRVFPTGELLNHVPLLIDGIADYVADPTAEVGVHMPVVAKAMELGELRHRQGFDAYEILKEYEFLGGILFEFFTTTVQTITEPCEKDELMSCGARLYRAVTIIQQSTMTHFLLLADKHVSEREDKLRAFNQVISHEIKNRIGAILGASSVLDEVRDMPQHKRDELLDIVIKNAREMNHTVENVLALSRSDAEDVRQHRNVRLSEAVSEGVRQVREAARAAGIEVRVSGGIPQIEVNAAVIELSVKNYLSNAIKYADPSRKNRFVEISASEESTSGQREIVIRVRDNGLGVPVDKRENLFERFFRAHEGMSSIEGTGLGLSIVREAAQSQGGRAWAEHPDDGGSVFAIALPLRRDPNAPATRRASAATDSPNHAT